MTASAPAAAMGAARPLSGYSIVAITLHWLIAALILTNIGLAWYFGSLPKLAQIPFIQFHKSIGITVLLLTLLRIGWRLTHPPPPLPEAMAGWERIAARATHLFFYGFMLAMPLSGWAMVSASPVIKVHPTVLYGLVPWPAFPLPGHGPDQLHAAEDLFHDTHSTLALIAYAMITLHVAAALKHHLLDRDDVLARMLPIFARRSGGLS